MIDTHAHLGKRFCDAVTGEELEGLKAVVLAASCLADSEDNIKLAENNPLLFASIGIHPQEAKKEDEMALLEEIIKKNKKLIVAVGECGLDFSESEPDQKTQKEIFRKQIGLAVKYKLPLIIHARKAVDEVIEILKEYKQAKGVFHCYAGGKKRIKKILELGENWYFGIDGNLTYEIGLTEVVAGIPQDKLLLETDCPFLTPIPHRGEKNKPEYVKFIYEKVAEIWQKSFAETEKIIDKNAGNLFGI